MLVSVELALFVFSLVDIRKICVRRIRLLRNDFRSPSGCPEFGANLTGSGTAVAHRLASDVIPEGHLRRGSVWVHQVRFDEEAVILIDDVKI